MIRVLHILPALNIGGVEIGVKRSRLPLLERFDYQVFSIKGPGSANVPTLSWMEFARHVADRAGRPQVVVSSLWPAHPLGYAMQAAGARWVPFFHAAGREGAPRDQILRWAAQRSRIRLCDSSATAAYFGFSGGSTVVCPFLFRTEQSALPDLNSRPFAIVVCGRLAPEKRPDLILSFLQATQERWPNQRSLLVLGGDDAAIAAFRAEVSSRHLDADILHNVPSETVPDLMSSAKFYLNLSDYEGFSMTTVEAILSGCVPVVRPVGEIPSYLEKNAGVYVDRLDDAGFREVIETCRRLSDDPDRRAAMVAHGRSSLDRYEDYVSAFSRAVDLALSDA